MRIQLDLCVFVSLVDCRVYCELGVHKSRGRCRNVLEEKFPDTLWYGPVLVP